MATARINDVELFYEQTGEGTPLVFLHEFAGDYRSWETQVRFFARRNAVVTFNARGYPPSEVPEDPDAYSQDIAVEDLRSLLDHLEIHRVHVVGFSMGGSAALAFGLKYPERARSVTIAGTGSGSSPGGDDAQFLRDMDYVAQRFESEGMDKVSEFYTSGPNRVQFKDKDPRGWREFNAQFRDGSAKGHANTMRGVQGKRPSVYALEAGLKAMTVPLMIMVGDEDEPCLQPGLYLKRTVASAALSVFPKTGHNINQEEPDLFNRVLLDFITQVDGGGWTLRNPASLGHSAVLNPAELRKADSGA
jgi:pimeloyl-ACP methyl ester carboxylesterase